MEQVVLDDVKIASVVARLRELVIPAPQESAGRSAPWEGSAEELSNCYFAIVAICHQTSPIGERPLEGFIGNTRLFGWDYLKEKFLAIANQDRRWIFPEFWAHLAPLDLADLYEDRRCGRTLNRVTERASLLNNAGCRLVERRSRFVSTEFEQSGRRLSGAAGFFSFLQTVEAYKDPVQKKSQFFAAIATQECGWIPADPASMSSVIDYHELRGHLRIGTIRIVEASMAAKVKRGMVLTEQEDTVLRQAVQRANDILCRATNTSSSALHYLMWNVFRNCCPRPARETHCSSCPATCRLPPTYKAMIGYNGRCIFSQVCDSANAEVKVVDPPYLGHYY